MAPDSVFDLLSADDLDSSLSTLFNDQDDAGVPIPDDQYAQHLQFQETLMSSLIASQTLNKTPSSSILSLPSSSKPSASMIVLQATPDPETHEVEAFQVLCQICAETRGSSQMFTNRGCDHSFCSECVTKQVATKIQDNIAQVSCPGLECKGVIELDACRPWLPKELVERWDQALCEALFLAASKFYCPFKDCSAMMVVEDEEEGVRESECPVCHRLFCARCYVPWHPGVGCEEYQRLNENERGRDDLILRELAKEKKWRRCPRCNYFVEKIDGCLHITCRCQFEFCYGCGEQWTATHGGCQTN